MKNLINLTIFVFVTNLSFGQNVSIGSCKSCQSTPNLFIKNFKIANGITSATLNTGTAWAYHNIYMESASVYNNFEFKKGTEYCIEIEFELSKQGNSNFTDHKFNIRAANHLVPNSNGPTQLPSILNTELIHEELYRNNRFNLSRPNLASINTLKINYTPTSDFKQIWFYVTTSSNGPTARFTVRNVDIREQGAKAQAKFVNPKRVEKINNTDVSVLCLDTDLLVDGTDSQCEDRYFVGLSEFNVFTWSDIKVLHSDWVKPLSQVPNNIKITDFLPQGYQLRPNKIYKFRLAVGIPWSSVDIFFKVDCCTSNFILNEQTQDKKDKGNFKIK
ncbi:hypothetical protein ACQY1Q_00935 [Tenacibaculum sp. TC6]|uniref:hypothetical protein n=1 Tax=Tenacibaculum sp. TC6 TaxID=3423223 RepID=UPI003D366A17